jgi:hypothetical protein
VTPRGRLSILVVNQDHQISAIAEWLTKEGIGYEADPNLMEVYTHKGLFSTDVIRSK